MPRCLRRPRSTWLAHQRREILPHSPRPAPREATSSCEEVLAVRLDGIVPLELRKLEEVGGAVDLVVILARVGELDVVLHARAVLDPHEVVVPAARLGNHVEAHEAVREEHLHLLVVRWEVAVRVGARVPVGPPPLVPARRELVRREATAPRGEARRDDDALLPVPVLVPLEDLGVHRHVLRRQLRHLVGLRVDPPQGLQVLQVVVLREGARQVHRRVVAPLGRHRNAPDLLHLGVVRGRHAVHVTRDLRPKVGDADELLEDVLGHDVRVPRLLDVVTVDVDVVHAEVEVGRGDRAHAPVRLGPEGRLLVRREGGDDELVPVHVGGLGGYGRELPGVLGLFLDLRDLLPLLRGRGDLRAQDDVADLALRQCAHVDVVLLGVIRQDEVLERDLDLDPLLVGEVRPHVVGLRDYALVGLEKHLGLLIVDVQRAQDENEAAEGGVGGDRLEPVVVDVEEYHLGLRRLENEVAELLDLEAGLEGQLQLAPLDDNVGEVEAVNLERVQHALAGHDDLLGLLLDGEGAHQRRHLLRGFPLGQLPEALLPGPHARVDDLEEQLPRARVEYEDRAVDGLGRQVAFECLVDRHAVHVGVVHEPDDLIGEELAVVLAAQVRLGGLGAVELQALADAFAQNVHGRVGLDDLGHCLAHEGLGAGEPVAEGTVEVVREVYADHAARGGGVDREIVRGVVEELGARVALDVMRVEVTPAQLHVQPILVGALLVVHVLAAVGHEAGLGDLPLVCGKKEDICAGGVHLIALARVDRLLLDRLDLERIQLLVEHLAEIHHDGLVHLLPEMRSHDLDQGDLERGDLAVHEDARQVQLDLETNVDVGAVDGRRPPQREAAVGDLVEPGALRVGELLVLHALLEPAGLLPEEALPSGEVGALEQRVLEDTLHAAQRLDDVSAVVVEVPELAVVALVRPPKGVDPRDLVLLEHRAHAPALVVRQGVAVLLEQRVNARDAPVPAVLEVLEREAPVLRLRLLPLERVLRPHALAVDELALPRLDVAVQVRDKLLLVVRHAAAEVGDPGVGLAGVAEVALRDEDVAHREHPQAADLLGSVEDHGREARGHL
mmetsp:Transcript_62206/g.196851  ORF Transcript_62206/g.196851 Transcript_62206/m.196851 type:complete len:1067 (-) Transcript_62206:4174-7374(-)